VVTEIRLYIEGGGDSKDGKAMLRRGFAGFLGALRDTAREKRVEWRIVVAGSRQNTLDAFRLACRIHAEAFNLLLVDSEDCVSIAPHEHIRRHDKVNVPADQCHLMVQIMEAWIVADRDAVRRFYGQGFVESALPATKDVESIAKDALLKGLENASRRTQKGTYHKIHHGAALLERVDSLLVRQSAPHCQRLFTTVTDAIH